ncbi:MAG: peptidylprolyl isomerase [Pseudomonadota bacterium]|nr:peptidylprolyl isomerase [Pseudomonadota bacterium]
MRKHLLPLAALLAATPALPQASANIAAGRAQPSPLAPAEIVNAAPKADWAAIAASDLLVMDLAPDAKGKARRVVIQLMPAPFSQGWVGNIRKLAAAKFWDGTSINRVQDNYVVQWGDANAEDKAKAKSLPGDLAVVPESRYSLDYNSITYNRARSRLMRQARPDFAPSPDEHRAGYWHTARDPFTNGGATFDGGWPLAYDGNAIWPVHCYGMVGVGRDMPPNTGTGAELYTVIGHAPRHLDRNIALVGRVIEGIEHLSSLPRGTGALGFYETPEERTGIVSIRIGSEVSGLPAYEYLLTESESFARYADARANRRDAFFIRPAGGADVCNIPVPVRRVK